LVVSLFNPFEFTGLTLGFSAFRRFHGIGVRAGALGGGGVHRIGFHDRLSSEPDLGFKG
jgi:hypothetical protein